MAEWNDELNDGWYDAYLQTERWKRLSIRCKERDGYTCQFCRRNEKELKELSIPLNAHHTTYEFLNSENEQLELDSLITLCETCHERLHNVMDHSESLSEHYKKIKLALVLPALPACIVARKAEIELGAQMAHRILEGCPRGYGIPNRVYRIVTEKIKERRKSAIDEKNLYLLRNYVPELYDGIQKRENILNKQGKRSE